MSFLAGLFGFGKKKGVAALIEDIRNGYEYARDNAVRSLRNYPDDARALTAIAEALRDPAVVVRSTAAWALGQIGDRGQLDALREAWQAENRGGNENVRAAITGAITKITGSMSETPSIIDEIADR